MVRALASHRWRPSLILGPVVTRGLSLLLVLVLAPRVFLRIHRHSSLHKNQHAKFQLGLDARTPSKRVLGLFGITWINKLPFFGIICDLLLNRRTAIWNINFCSISRLGVLSIRQGLLQKFVCDGPLFSTSLSKILSGCFPNATQPKRFEVNLLDKTTLLLNVC